MRPAPRLSAGLLAVLGFISAVGPFATDAYLSSFTEIARDLSADPASIQLTLTAFLLGMGAGQLVVGPMSDRRGRRRVLLIGLAVFALASTAMIATPGIEVFLVLRVIQGFAGASGVVIARAVAADLSEGHTAVRALSLIATLVALGPLIAPPIGAVIGAAFGWRGVLVFIAAVAWTMLVCVALVVPESLPAEARQAGGLRTTLARMRDLVRDGRFVALVAAFATGFAAMMAYISASPFVGQIVAGMSPVAYAFGFAAGAVGIILANLVNSRIAPRVGPDRMLRVGVALITTAGIAYVALALADGLGPATFIATAFVLTAGAGLTMSNATALALARAPRARGSASALAGALQFAAGAIVSPLVGLWGEDTALPMAIIVAACGCAALVTAFVATRPEPPRTA